MTYDGVVTVHLDRRIPVAGGYSVVAVCHAGCTKEDGSGPVFGLYVEHTAGAHHQVIDLLSLAATGENDVVQHSITVAKRFQRAGGCLFTLNPVGVGGVRAFSLWTAAPIVIPFVPANGHQKHEQSHDGHDCHDLLAVVFR